MFDSHFCNLSKTFSNFNIATLARVGRHLIKHLIVEVLFDFSVL
jgi:hypothetical protein